MVRRFRWQRLAALSLVSLVALVAVLGGPAPGSPRAAAQGAHSATLVAGWNTVAYLGDAAPPAQALAPIVGSVTRALVWDAAAQQWKTYDPARPFLSTLTQLQPYDSLFILASGAATWTQSGGATHRTVPLASGWNLIAWTGEDSTSLSGAFAGLPLDGAFRYDTGTGGYQRYTPGVPAALNTLTGVQFGDVLWVRVAGGQSWALGAGGDQSTSLVADFASQPRTGSNAQQACVQFAGEIAALMQTEGSAAVLEDVYQAVARTVGSDAGAAAQSITDASLDAFIFSVGGEELQGAQAPVTDVGCGTRSLSVYFVNGILNTSQDAAASGARLSALLGVPIRVVYNHSLIEPRDYRVEMCRRALVRDYPYYEEADPANETDPNDGYFARAAAWADWLAGAVTGTVGRAVNSGLSVACAGIDGTLDLADATFVTVRDAVYSSTQLAAQRLTSLNIASSSVNATLVPAIEQDLIAGKGVILLAHSQGTLFIQNAITQVQTWWNTQAPEELRDQGPPPIANLYISPAFDFYSTRTGEEDYVLLDGDALLATTVTVSPATATPSASQRGDSALYRALKLHELNTYLEAGSSSVSQIQSKFAALRAYVEEQAVTAIGESGVIQATLSWSTPSDIDLHTYEPSGRHVYWSSQSGESGDLDRDDTSGTGPENYRVLECDRLQAGAYRFAVNYYSGPGDPPPTVTATVTVTAGGVTQTRSVTLSNPDQGDTIIDLFTVTVTITTNAQGQSQYTFAIGS